MPVNTNIMRTPDVQKLLEQYQTGTAPVENEALPEMNDGTQQPEETTQPSLYDAIRMPIQRGGGRSNIDEALAAGYGTSRFDTDYYPGQDLENARAISQSGFAKIGSGLLKGGITAVSTALNTTLGLVYGAGSSLFELGSNIFDHEQKNVGEALGDSLNAGVNNKVSEALIKLQDWGENVLPNYRTEQERSEEYQRQWYRHMGSANFIGDSILKNFGFTVGAMGGGLAWTKAIGSAMTKRLANNIMKGAASAALGGDAEASAAMQRAAEAVQRGTAIGVDGERLSANLQKAARSLNRKDAILQVTGSVIGAMGEGTVEGIMAKNEFLEDYKRRADAQFREEYNNLENELLESGNRDWVEERLVMQADGTLSRGRVLTEKGQAWLASLQRQAVEDHQDRMRYAEQQGQNLASTTFLLNLPLLTTSNIIQFGRMFSGGWKTNRNLASRLNGGVKAGKAGITADYAARGSRAGRTILNSLKVAGSEAFEEMAQGTLSSGTKQVAESNISSYNDGGYDEVATNQVKNWFMGTFQGWTDYLSDVKNWQEGAIGALTGLFGMPGKRWSGGIAEAYRDAKAEDEAAAKLNSLVNSKEFQDRWRGYIRHLKYDNQMQEAIENDDEYAWHTADDAQLVSDVMMFADQGKLEDLKQIVDHYGGVTEADADAIREAMANKDNPEADWTQNLSDKEIVDKITKQANRISRTIEQYKDVHDALAAMAPIGTTPEFLNEMVSTVMNIKAFEDRFMTLFGETMDGLEPLLLAASAMDAKGNDLSVEESKQRFKNLRDNYERIFAGTVLPVRLPKSLRDHTEKGLDALEEFTESDPELKAKIMDMRALSESRQAYYKKLLTLQNDKNEQAFTEAAATQDKVDEAADQVYAKQQTENLKTVTDVKQAYFSKDAKGRTDFLNTIASVEESNPAVKEFLALKRRADAFRAFIEKNGINTEDVTVTPVMINRAVNDLLKRAKSEAELINLPDNMFSSLDEFIRDNTSIFGAPSAGTHASVKQAIRMAMQNYMAAETGTASRNTVASPTPAQSSTPANTSTPTGRDAAQPASMEPAPAPAPLPAWMTAGPAETPAQEQSQIDDNEYNAIVERLKKDKGEVGAAQRRLDLERWLKSDKVAQHFKIYGKGASDVKAVVDRAIADNPDIANALEDILNDEELSNIIKSYITPAETAQDAEEKGQSGEVTVSQPARSSILQESFEAERDDTDEVLSEEKQKEGGKEKTVYYRTSVPEIDTGEASKAREATKSGDRSARMSADLSDFVQKNPQYATIWNALASRNAFANTSEVNKGDVIEFVIDPTFPTYNGNYQILVTTVKDGERKVLTILSNQTSKYFGLGDLRGEIDKEYRAFRSSHPNEMFVFSKKSKVFAKRAGLIDYDFSHEPGSYGEERGIQDIPGYDANAPIVFIDRFGEARVISGSDKDAAHKVSDSFDSADLNRDNEKRGNLYYLAKAPNGKYEYIPIRLWTEHFREQNKDADNDTFRKIRKILSDIAELVQNTNNTNLAEGQEKLRKHMRELGKYLDIHNDFFTLDNFNNVGIALRYSTPTDTEGTLRRPEQMTADWLINFVAGLGRSVQIRQDSNGRIIGIDELVQQGLITTNARMLRPKGSDFYFNAWDPVKKDFVPMTAAQQEAVSETARDEEMKKALEPKPVRSNESIDDQDFGGRDEFDDPEDIAPAHGEKAPQERKPSTQEENPDTEAQQERAASVPAQALFANLPKETQEALLAKGYSEKEYNEMPEMLKDKVLRCLGV